MSHQPSYERPVNEDELRVGDFYMVSFPEIIQGQSCYRPVGPCALLKVDFRLRFALLYDTARNLLVDTPLRLLTYPHHQITQVHRDRFITFVQSNIAFDPPGTAIIAPPGHFEAFRVARGRFGENPQEFRLLRREPLIITPYNHHRSVFRAFLR